jgi:predicted nucleic acid-binding protein
MNGYLLDISVLLAWLLGQHPNHQDVIDWEKGKEVAICPIAELGFLRIACNTYGGTLAGARKALAEWKAKRKPTFVPCDIPASAGKEAPGWQHATDFYMANLADHHGMKLATTDGRIRHPAAETI